MCAGNIISRNYHSEFTVPILGRNPGLSVQNFRFCMSDTEIEALRRRVAELEAENAHLRLHNQEPKPQAHSDANGDLGLSLAEYRRYGRQMIVPEFGSLPAQLKLKNARILVVGAGGLGCPALLYLAAAGIGTIGIVDNDIVEHSNLHRQVLHSTARVGMLKCESAKTYLNQLNPHVRVELHTVKLSNENSFDIIGAYDLVVDCIDTPATRYLINDVSVLSGKPIVSGSGVTTYGQLSILNFDNSGPCYRCFYPQPPKPESVSTCGDSGVFGPAIGLMGVMLAIETIKVLTGHYDTCFAPFLLLYSAYPPSLRSFKMRGRKTDCAVCGAEPTITKEIIESGAVDYHVFCGSVSYNVVAAEERLSAVDAHGLLNTNKRALLIDVRPKEQYLICNIANSQNIEWERTLSRADSIEQYCPPDFRDCDPILVICRYGNDSRHALRRLKDVLHYRNVYDVVGGIDGWSKDIDPLLPQY